MSNIAAVASSLIRAKYSKIEFFSLVKAQLSAIKLLLDVAKLQEELQSQKKTFKS